MADFSSSVIVLSSFLVPSFSMDQNSYIKLSKGCSGLLRQTWYTNTFDLLEDFEERFPSVFRYSPASVHQSFVFTQKGRISVP